MMVMTHEDQQLHYDKIFEAEFLPQIDALFTFAYHLTYNEDDANDCKDDAKDWERINDWIDRIGWPRFFELTELPFTKYLIDDWRGARKSLNASSYIRF